LGISWGPRAFWQKILKNGPNGHSRREIPTRSPRPSHLKDPLFNLAKQPNRRVATWDFRIGQSRVGKR